MDSQTLLYLGEWTSPIVHFLREHFYSHYRNTPWFKKELSFVACAFPSHLQACVQGECETQTYNPYRFACQFGFDQGILGHLSTSTLALLVVVASLAFKRENLIKILVSSPKIPFTSPTRVGLPLPRFKLWWSVIREHVRNFGKVVPNKWMSHLLFREI